MFKLSIQKTFYKKILVKNYYKISYLQMNNNQLFFKKIEGTLKQKFQLTAMETQY